MNVINTPQADKLNELYLQAAHDLLSIHDIPGDPISQEELAAPNMRSSYVSLLGAIGEGIALSSMIKISRQLLTVLHPFGTSGASDADFADYCRELNNQLVGRLKNKLLRYGASLTLGLPVLLTGTDVAAVRAPDATLHENSINTARGRIFLILETIVDPDLELEEIELTEDEAMLEGAVALF